MAISTADFKNGMCIMNNGKMCTIVEFQHVKPGKGGAFVRTKLRDIKTGRVVEYTFNAGTKFDQVRLETKKMQYLYNDGADFYFMDNDTFEQIFPLIATVLSVGMLQNAMSATGVKGLIGITFITMPVYLIYATVLFIAPMLQGALNYGSAVVFGAPLIFMFNSMGYDPKIAAIALSLMFPIGDCLPPSRITGRLAIEATGYEGKYTSFLLTVLAPCLVLGLISLAMLIWPNSFTFLL